MWASYVNDIDDADASSSLMDTQETPASWLLYFGDEPFSSDDRRVKLIESLCLFYLKPEGWEFLLHLRLGLHPAIILSVDFEQLRVQSQLEDLQPAIELQPQECLGCLGAAVFEARSNSYLVTVAIWAASQ